jgi:hypothetical protein
MFQFQITKSLEQQIQGHVLEVLKLRKELATLRQEKERGPFGEDVALATATRKIQVLRESLISLYKFGTMYTSPEHPIFTHARNLIERTK